MVYAKTRKGCVGGVAAVLGTVVILALPGFTFGGEFSMIVETNDDAGGGSEVFEVSFADFDDFLSNYWVSGGFTLVNASADYSIRGHAYGESRHHLLYESDADSSSGSEVWIGSFSSLADIYANNWWVGDYSDINVNPLWSVGGFAYDGSQYHVLLESNDDASGGNEVYIMSYNSFADVFTNTQASADYSLMNISEGFSIGGFTFDDGKYYIVFETNEDAGAGAEIWVNTYNSFADVLSNNFAVTQVTQVNVSSTFGVAGFAGRVPIFGDGFDWGLDADWSQ